VKLQRDWRSLFPVDGVHSDAAEWTSLFDTQDDVPDSDLWAGIAKAIDTRMERPEARIDVIAEPLPGDKGVVLCDEKNGVYVRLASEDAFLWGHMDGSRTQVDLVVDYMMQYKALAPDRVAGLVATLSDQGLLTGPRTDLYPSLKTHFLSRTPMGRINTFTQLFLKREFAISDVDRLVGAVYRAGARLLYARIVLLLFWLISLIGGAAFIYILSRREFSVLGEGELVSGAAMLAIFQLLSIFLHEWAHALTVKHYGRKVRRAGFFLLLGIPGVFVDTTDIWPAGQRAQLAVTWAGPFCNLVLGGIAAFVLIANPAASYAPLAFQFAISQYSLVLLNLTPFIRLDGYYLLADGLGITNLSQRSGGFLRMGFPAKLRAAWREGHLLPRLTREETILVIFGGMSALWIANLLGLAILTAPVRIVTMFERFVNGGFASASIGTTAFALAGVLFTVLLMVRAVSMIKNWVQKTQRDLRDAPSWRAALILSIAALILALIPDALVWRGIALPVTTIYTRTLSLAAAAIALLVARRLSRELRGAGLRISMLGLQVTAMVLVLLDAVSLLDVLLPVPDMLSGALLSLVAAAALTPAVLGAALALQAVRLLLFAPLRWGVLTSLVGGAMLIANALFPDGVQSLFFAVAGRSLIASSLLLHSALIARPLPLRRIAPVEAGDEPADLLAAAASAIARELAQALAEIAGKPSMLQLATEFNSTALSADWPLWLTMTGSLGDQTTGTATERGPIYRAALDALQAGIADRMGSAFARDAYVQAVAELPLILRAAVERWLLPDDPSQEGIAVEDDRVRLRLAGRRLADTLLIGCACIYGWRLTEEAIGGFNRVAAAAHWPLYVRGNGRLADDLHGALTDISGVYADALQELLGRIAAVAGVGFVERGVVQVYDSLPWEVREVSRNTLFRRLSWARTVADQSDCDPRVDFLRTVPLLGWLDPADLGRLASMTRVRRVRAGKTLLNIGAYLDQILVVRQGRVEALTIEADVCRPVELIAAGGLIGLRTVMDCQPLLYEYVAQTDLELWEIPADAAQGQLAMLRQLQSGIDHEQTALSLLSRVPMFALLETARRVKLASALHPIQRLLPDC
jgi:putative peptide zinc metalloprotease protein